MLRYWDRTSFVAISIILVLTAGNLWASVTYDWTSTDGGGAGTVVFNKDPGGTADPATDIESFAFSNEILSDWSLADKSGSWTIPLSLTTALTPQNNGLVLYFERATGADTRTLTFYYIAPLVEVEGQPIPEYEYGGPGWFWKSIIYPGMIPSELEPQPASEAPQYSEVPEEGDSLPPSTVVGEGGSGLWGLPDGSGPAAVPVPTSLLLALAGVGICRTALRRRGACPR